MYMFRYRRAKECKACVVNHTNSCATNITIAQPRNAPPKPNRQKAIKTVENGEEVATFVPNQNTVQDSYFFSGGFGNPNGSNRKLMTLSRPVKSRLSAINGSFRQGSSWANGYMTHSQSNLESNLGSMGRLDRLKAKAIAGDREKCFPIKLGQPFYINLDIDSTTSGYVEGKICNQVAACGKGIFGDVNGCFNNVNLLNFNLLALESSSFPSNYNINTNVFYIFWKQKSGLASASRPAFNSITVSGRKRSDGTQASVTLLFSEADAPGYSTGLFFGGVAGNVISIQWTPAPALGNRVQDINDIFNGPSGKRIVVTFN
tara:strand:+ start:291 stop:1241 length:951 start_codon:yes stop_codon:yes gene_type:complete